MRKANSDEDCADCLCRSCARNRYVDSYNSQVEKDGEYCEGCNNCKGYVIDTEDDCPRGNPLPDETEGGCLMNAYKIAIEAIEAVNKSEINGREFEERIAPLRDVEKVVRCKDCKNCIVKACHKGNREGNQMENKYFCYGAMHGNCVQPDFYCADGERK